MNLAYLDEGEESFDYIAQSRKQLKSRNLSFTNDSAHGTIESRIAGPLNKGQLTPTTRQIESAYINANIYTQSSLDEEGIVFPSEAIIQPSISSPRYLLESMSPSFLVIFGPVELHRLPVNVDLR